jgi:hypothetical protein
LVAIHPKADQLCSLWVLSIMTQLGHQDARLIHPEGDFDPDGPIGGAQ